MFKCLKRVVTFVKKESIKICENVWDFIVNTNGNEFVKAGGFVMFLGIGAGLSLIGYGVFKEII